MIISEFFFSLGSDLIAGIKKREGNKTGSETNYYGRRVSWFKRKWSWFDFSHVACVSLQRQRPIFFKKNPSISWRFKHRRGEKQQRRAAAAATCRRGREAEPEEKSQWKQTQNKNAAVKYNLSAKMSLGGSSEVRISGLHHFETSISFTGSCVKVFPQHFSSRLTF